MSDPKKPDAAKTTETPAQGSAPTAAAATAAQPHDLAKVIHELQGLQATLKIQSDAIQDKIHRLEQAFHENDNLRKENQALIEQIKSLEVEEWKRKNEYFPDIYLDYVVKLNEKMTKK